MRMDSRHLSLFFLISCVFATSCFAADQERIAEIKSRINQFINTHQANLNPDDQLTITINDTAIPEDLPQCKAPIEVMWPAESVPESATSVLLSCKSTISWQSYIPVTIEIKTPVLLAKETIPKNDPIANSSITKQYVDKKQLYNGYYRFPEEVVGKIAARTLMAGTIITKRSIQQPRIITRNQVITITAGAKGIQVSMKGVARSEGGLDEMIQVYNPSSKRVIDAIVTGPSSAKVIG